MKIVGVSACIAGLAHTPMAAKALEKAGKKLGYNVKIEQQGAMGIINKLSESEIKEADVVIFAVDKSIEGEERFKGKKIVKVKINQCVSNAEAVLNKIVSVIGKK